MVSEFTKQQTFLGSIPDDVSRYLHFRTAPSGWPVKTQFVFLDLALWKPSVTSYQTPPDPQTNSVAERRGRKKKEVHTFIRIGGGEDGTVLSLDLLHLLWQGLYKPTDLLHLQGSESSAFWVNQSLNVAAAPCVNLHWNLGNSYTLNIVCRRTHARTHTSSSLFSFWCWSSRSVEWTPVYESPQLMKPRQGLHHRKEWPGELIHSLPACLDSQLIKGTSKNWAGSREGSKTRCAPMWHFLADGLVLCLASQLMWNAEPALISITQWAPPIHRTSPQGLEHKEQRDWRSS